MWLGYPQTAGALGAAATTNAHFDGVDNLFAVLSGQKTFHLCSYTALFVVIKWHNIILCHFRGPLLGPRTVYLCSR